MARKRAFPLVFFDLYKDFRLTKLSFMTKPAWPTVLAALLEGQDLNRGLASWAMGEIMQGLATPAQIGAFMLALRSKGESVEELAGLVDVMLASAVILETGNDAVDIVGTGGDLIGTVNISSMAAIVAAAAGVPVLKHGSRSASGKTGSSEMLEVLGIRLDLAPAQVAQVFDTHGITFFFAPVFHPAMRHVAPIRKELGVPTTFNFLGPLANPAQPIATALGVANREIAPLMAQELANRGRSGLVFRSGEGLDELSITSPNEIWEVSGGSVTRHTLDVGFDPAASLEELIGGDAHHNADVALRLFDGETAGNYMSIKNIVLLNAAAGMVSYELAKDPAQMNLALDVRFENALGKVTSALETGMARQKLTSWSQATQQF
jgi:anthranilate phosphoribosyltransferase